MKLKRLARWIAGATALALLLLVTAVFVAYCRSDNDCGKTFAPHDSLMKAIVYCDYGDVNVLKLEDVSKPACGNDQVLIKVHAASVNPLDWHYMRGTPYLMRMETGLRKPKSRRFGVDVAGEVVAVGGQATQFKLGDRVFGAGNGALAEYCVAKSRLALIPTNVTFAQAAALPIAGVTALQALRDKGHLQAGQKVLINGASGGVGTFAVQIAKALGANVTGVCSGRSASLVRSLGADHVIDYTKEDFTKSTERYDLILDCVGTQPLLGFKKVLKPAGICVLIGGGGPDEGRWIGPMARPLKAMLLSPFISQKMNMMLADIRHQDLDDLAGLMASGKLTSVIDRTFPLSETPDAIRYLQNGHAHGKVIVTVP